MVNDLNILNPDYLINTSIAIFEQIKIYKAVACHISFISFITALVKVRLGSLTQRQELPEKPNLKRKVFLLHILTDGRKWYLALEIG